MLEHFIDTAKERYLIMLRRENGNPPNSWTDDPIFQTYRFCNVFREHDRVTRWYRQNVSGPIGHSNVDQFRAAVVFRLLNRETSGELIKHLLLPGQWDPDAFEQALRQEVAAKRPILGGAYMIKTPTGMDKVAGILEILSPLEAMWPTWAGLVFEAASLQLATEALVELPYIGPFMAYQMVCDMKETPLLERARDRMTWTSPGPGSARGIGRLLHGDPGHFRYSDEKDRSKLIAEMQNVLQEVTQYWPKEWPKWELSTVQHWACEFDKYERVRLGEGRPKQLFTPKPEKE